jgi:hypothetical protein
LSGQLRCGVYAGYTTDSIKSQRYAYVTLINISHKCGLFIGGGWDK